MSQLDGISDPHKTDWRKFDIKVGLEIHRQLKGSKLFCSCKGHLDEEPIREFRRKLHLTRSELGEADLAALHETGRGRTNRYQVTDNCCLVDMDEEPPHLPSEKNVNTALTIAELFRCRIAEEIQFMRKIVVDGSNTTGFQRTALVGLGGYVEAGRRIGITSICLEEDAARKIDETGDEVVYRLDRVGIPEIAITTDPEINDPQTAALVAERIGNILKSTGMVRRGGGTIRQDVNISVPGGTRIELKLVSDLALIPKAVEAECVRQLLLLDVAGTLKERGINKRELDVEHVDLTNVLEKTRSRIIKKGIDGGGTVMGVILKGFGGLMGEKGGGRPGIDDVRRLGPEFAQYARIKSGVKGLFHSDELPGYDISKDEVKSIKKELALEGDNDGFVVICGVEESVHKALDAVVERARLAINGVPAEVRRPLPDGTSEFMRPMPGAARMYPETDIPQIPIGPDRLERLFRDLPEDPALRIDRISAEHSLDPETVNQMGNLDLLDLFEEIAAMGIEPRLCSSLLLHAYPRAVEGGLDPLLLDLMSIEMILDGLAENRYSKEALPDVLVKVLRDHQRTGDIHRSAENVVCSYSTDTGIIDRVRSFIYDLIKEREKFVRDRGMNSIGPLMGPIMKEFRGKVDGKELSEMLKAEIERFLGD